MELKIPKAFAELFKPARYKTYWGGRGSGKSTAFADVLLIDGIQKPLRIFCGREFQNSISDSVHKLLADRIMAHNMADHYRIMEKRIESKIGGEFLFKGLRHNVREIKSMEGIDRAWLEEAENISDGSWELLIPTIRKPGSEIWTSFNAKNPTDPTYVRRVTNADEGDIVRKVSWRDNPFFPDVLRVEKDKLQRQDPAAYAHIWEGEFDTRRSGSIYAKILAKAREEGRIGKVPYDPGYEVFTAWDLGWGDSTVIWWLQWVGRELRWIEAYDNNGEQLSHYVDIVKSKKYNYSQTPVYLPHDGGAGNIRGDSVSNQLSSMGLRNVVLARETDINPGIELVRQTLQFSVFDQEKTKDGIHALEHYVYEWDEDRGIFKTKPAHNWASHYADAARYAAQAAKMARESLTKVHIAEPGSTANNSMVW